MIRVNDTHAALDGDFEAKTITAFPAINAPMIDAAESAGGTSNAAAVADQANGPVQSEPTPTGGEFRVNTYTTGAQQIAAVAALAGGGFVVTWSSNGQDGSSWGIYGQRYTAAGVADGGELQVNTYTTSHQLGGSVAALASGGFVVAWSSDGQDGSGFGVYGQRYTAAGVADGGEFRVNTFITNTQFTYSIAALADGGFVVTWSSGGQDGSGQGVHGQRFTAAGVADGGEFQINTFTFNDQTTASVTALLSGGFVVTWSSLNQDGSGYGIYGQRYTAAGAADGSEFQVNTYTTGNQFISPAAALADGGFVVTWSSDGQDGSSFGIYGQRYTAAGVADGSEFRINSYTTDAQQISLIVALADGGFVVTWTSNGQDGSSFGVYGQRFDAAGVADGGEFLINQTTSGSQFQNQLQSVAILADGSLVVAWQGEGSGDNDGIFARQFALPASNQAPVVDLNGAATGIDAAVSWTEGAGGTAAVPGIILSDADSANLTGATVTIASGFVTGDSLRMSGGLSGTTASGITFSYNAGTGVLTLSGSATVADYQTALATLSFKSSNNAPGTARDITVVVNDGAASSVAAHIALTVTATNDAPVNSVPGAQAETSGGTIVFSAANGNALTISDADAGAGLVRVKLVADHGIIKLFSQAGLTVDGDATGKVIITGTIADINIALNGLNYDGEPGYTGADSLTLTTNDLGGSGSGGPLIDKDSVAINWAPGQAALKSGGQFDLAGLGPQLAGAAAVFDFVDLAGFGAQAAVVEPTSLDLAVQAEPVVWHDPLHGGSDFML